MTKKRTGADGTRFYTVKGKKLVSVTTFLKVVGKPFLFGWYARQEREHSFKVLQKLVDEGASKKKILRVFEKALSYWHPLAAVQYMEKAGRFGNVIHAAVECYLNNDDLPAMKKRHKKVFKQFVKWWKASGFKILKAEHVVYNMKLGYAGTLDALVVGKNKKRIIIDWKTGKSIYPDHYHQNVAYLNCDNVKADEGLLVHIPRDGSKVTAHPVIQGKKKTPTMKDVEAILNCWRAVNKEVN